MKRKVERKGRRQQHNTGQTASELNESIKIQKVISLICKLLFPASLGLPGQTNKHLSLRTANHVYNPVHVCALLFSFLSPFWGFLQGEGNISVVT